MIKRLCGSLGKLHLLLLLITITCFSCKFINTTVILDSGKPKRTLKDYYDKKYLLYQLPDTFYTAQGLNHSFTTPTSRPVSDFKPLGHNTSLKLQYTHVYSSKCVYNDANNKWKYAEVSFPNTCLTKDNAYASVKVSNTSGTDKTYYVRLFYQNTSYWHSTGDSINLIGEPYLDNYYGSSSITAITLPANSDSIVQLAYTIGMNPKHEFDYDPSKDPARPGNYEFMVLALPAKDDLLMSEGLDLMKVNPFAVVKKDELQNGGKRYFSSIAYTGPQHFKFVFLDEYFDGVNDLADNHIYLPKGGGEKKLCDTCSGWYTAVINEYWKSSDFFGGYLSKAYFVKADYGIRLENYQMDSNGITLTIPKSTRGNYKKTWGEFLFGPSFKYGHVTIRAKVAQMMNKTGTPNGIIHNLWLYQRDPDTEDTSHQYAHLHNGAGKQPYEIDFEIWNSQEDINTMWDDNAFINYSIVDYMRNENATIKPGEMKRYGKYKANRFNERQINVPGENLPRKFFESFHLFELYWHPDKVVFLVDGFEHAVITKDMASIPDKYLFLWIGSPLYQDGTYYNQSLIPFLKEDKQTIVDYIRIE